MGNKLRIWWSVRRKLICWITNSSDLRWCCCCGESQLLKKCVGWVIQASGSEVTAVWDEMNDRCMLGWHCREEAIEWPEFTINPSSEWHSIYHQSATFFHFLLQAAVIRSDEGWMNRRGQWMFDGFKASMVLMTEVCDGRSRFICLAEWLLVGLK